MKTVSILKNGLALIVALIAILLPASSAQARGKVQGTATYSQIVTTVGRSSSQEFPRILASATITVYTPTATQNLATLYSDSAGTAKGNSFTAGADGSYAFYTDAPSVDIRVSGITGVPDFTISDLVVGDSNGSVTPVCAGTNDTSLFSSIITSVGSNTSTINLPYIAGSRCAVNNLTIPANVTLDNSNGTGIKINTGQTLTIVGPMEAAPQKTFYNATAGLGRVSFTGNNSLKNLQIAWWGAIGDGVTDDTAALNAALVAWPHGTIMNLSPHAIYRHTGITIDRKFQVTLLGNDSQDGYVDAVTGPKFVYAGADGGNAITISNCYASTFKGFGSWGAATNASGPTGLAKNLYVTMAASGYPPISSQNVFQSLFLLACTSRSSYIAVDINNPSGTNNEFHRFIGCKIIGDNNQAFPNQVGTGIHLGHANVKQIYIEGTSFLSLAKDIDSDSGSFRGSYNSHSGSGIIYYGTFSDAAVVIGDDSEGCTQVLQFDPGVGSGAPFTIIGSRYDDLHGAGTPSATRSNDPILRWGEHLTVQGSRFTAVGNAPFTSNFLNGFAVDDVSAIGLLTWEGNIVTNLNQLDFNTALAKFQGTRAFLENSTPGFVLSSSVFNQNSFKGIGSTPLARDVVGVQRTNGTTTGDVAAQDSIVLGDSGQVELAGLARPQRPDDSIVGIAGSTAYSFVVIARDALGNRTMPSLGTNTATANASLSGANYVHLTWPKVVGVTDYLVLQFSADTWRTVATVSPSETNIESYNVVVNPSAAFTYVIPTYNETGINKFRGVQTLPNEVTFTSLDATPSVAKANDFVTANAGATSITTFDNGQAGQLIRIRTNDANTTFVNGSGILTRTGANVAATNGLIYQFIRRGSNWYQL